MDADDEGLMREFLDECVPNHEDIILEEARKLRLELIKEMIHGT